MLYTNIDAQTEIAVLEADGPLSRDDFLRSRATFKEYISAQGKLKGLIIYTEKFPGWASVKDLPYHFLFANDHRNKAQRVAFVTDSLWSTLVSWFGWILTGTETKVFKHNEFEQAKHWVLD